MDKILSEERPRFSLLYENLYKVMKNILIIKIQLSWGGRGMVNREPLAELGHLREKSGKRKALTEWEEKQHVLGGIKSSFIFSITL